MVQNVVPPGSPGESRSLTVVVVEQPATPALASDRLSLNLRSLWRRVFARAHRPVAQGLVWPEPVVIEDIRLHDVVQLAQAEAEEEIQALAFAVTLFFRTRANAPGAP